MKPTAPIAHAVLSVALILVPVALEGRQFDPELAILGGYGIEPPYRGGIGVTGGVTFNSLYGGGRLVRHFGNSRTRTLTTETTTVEQTSWLYAIEFGLPIDLKRAEARLTANVGLFRFREDTVREPVGGGAPTEDIRRKTTTMFAPAASLLVPLGRIKAGAEVVLLNGGDPNFSETFGTRSVAFYAKIVIPTRP